MQRLILFCTIIFGFTHSNNIQAQNSGDNIFDISMVHEIRLSFSQNGYWSTLVNNFENNQDGNIPYLMGTVMIDGIETDSIGARFKGFTSYPYESNKKPIKLDFNEFVPGQRMDGLRKLNLNNSTGDPSMHRDVICYDLMREMGVKAPRAAFSKVYINDEYWGLYQVIEQIDKEFLQNNFANSEGNLFKNKGWSHFEWNGSSPNNYNPPFELKTNREGDDWSGFVNLMDVLNNASDTEFAEEIEKIFNVDLFLKTLAVDVATNNWDSYLEHGRNWYIYEDTATNIFHWIPWDYNFALSGGFFGGGGGDCEIFVDFLPHTNGTKTVSFFDQTFYGSQVSWTWDFGDGNTSNEQNPVHMYAESGQYTVCLTADFQGECSDQFCKTIDTDENPADCPSFVNGSADHEPDETITQILNWIPSCCEVWGEECEEIYNSISGELDGSGFSIDQSENSGVLIKRLLSVPDFQERYYNHFCSLTKNVMKEERLFDLINYNKELIKLDVQNDPNSLFSYNAFLDDIGDASDSTGIKAVLSKRIQYITEEIDTLHTCSTIAMIDYQNVVVNEFVASNDSTSNISDPAGGFADWIELHNNTNSAIDLSDTYFSDNKDDLKKWQFPSGTEIGANGYLIVWADDDEEQEGIHSNFKLSKSGEELVLSNTDGTIIDSLTFGEQTTNIAAARIPNGTGDFVFQASTFNGNNEFPSSISDFKANFEIEIHPNPTSDFLYGKIRNDLSMKYLARIISYTGQLLMSGSIQENKFEFPVSQIPAGLYVLQVTDENGRMIGQKFVKE